MSYFPKFKKSEDRQSDEPEILFNFTAKMKSLHNFKQVCHPAGFTVTENSMNDIVLQKLGGDLTDIKKDIQILFKSTNSNTSEYVYQRNLKQFPGEVAVMAQFMPTFNSSESMATADKIEYTTDADDMVEDDVNSNLQAKLVFSFIVDRSGSMGGIRIDIAKEALNLFMQSLPTGSYFQIISFGCNYSHMELPGHKS